MDATVRQMKLSARLSGETFSLAPAKSFHLLGAVDPMRAEACCRLEQNGRAEKGQFLTPAPVAQLMASLLVGMDRTVSLLDAGAGVGSLFAAATAALCERPDRPERIHVVAYEVEPLLADYAEETLRLCRLHCDGVGVAFSGEVRHMDFLRDAVCLLEANLLNRSPRIAEDPLRFNCAVQNPPYRKIHTDSEARRLLRRLGIETTNLYTGFLAATLRLLAPGGELVTITPRSFCNGRYFRAFRREFLRDAALRRLHLFETRQEAFKNDNVLQEALILRATKDTTKPDSVIVTSGMTADDDFLWRNVPYTEVVRPDDAELFIRVAPDEGGRHVAHGMARFTTPLEALGLRVSTGRVVDFRATEHLRQEPAPDTAPLIYPLHLNGGGGYVSWPKPGTKKPNALAICGPTETLRVPNGNYVLVKRFSSKEQAKRITAAVYEAARVPAADGFGVGFENHLNYFHANGQGMDLPLARGLTVFLNATLVDEFFRLYSGHTQVNATDLRSLKYPTLPELRTLGEQVGDVFPDQDAIDRLVEKELFRMEEEATSPGQNPVAVKKRVEEALQVLTRAGLPAAQQNERSALTLLALLDLKPVESWSLSRDPLRGITPIMEFVAHHYGKTYKPNTRETVRRFTVHQFLDAGLLIANPDKPNRPINSPQTVYQMEPSALALLRTFGTPEWEQNLAAYLASVETLKRDTRRSGRRNASPSRLRRGRRLPCRRAARTC